MTTHGVLRSGEVEYFHFTDYCCVFRLEVMDQTLMFAKKMFKKDIWICSKFASDLTSLVSFRYVPKAMQAPIMLISPACKVQSTSFKNTKILT